MSSMSRQIRAIPRREECFTAAVVVGDGSVLIVSKYADALLARNSTASPFVSCLLVT